MYTRFLSRPHPAARGDGAVTSLPHRIQRKRTKGWKMPPNTVYVGRPTCWGNPHVITPGISREEAISRYRANVTLRAGTIGRLQRELRGKNLCCWCSLALPCHADVLLEIANTPTPKEPR
jgi:hypothetical protein